jgi:hypothetical protein
MSITARPAAGKSPFRTAAWTAQQIVDTFPDDTAPSYLLRDRDAIHGECLNHVLVLSERHLRNILTGYVKYYHRTRTHLSLTKDAPDGRPVEPPELGQVVPIPEVGGLHHRYVRRAA